MIKELSLMGFGSLLFLKIKPFYKMKQLIVIVFVVLFSFSGISQQSETIDFRYISPLPGSSFVNLENNIAFRHGDFINKSSLQEFSITVEGSEQGIIKGKTFLSTDNKTVIFQPDVSFQPGERIHVSTTGRLLTIKGKILNPVSFWFDVSKLTPQLPKNYTLENELGLATSLQKPLPVLVSKGIQDNNLPEDFPELTINYSNNPNETEYYFAAPFGYWGWFPNNVPYLIIFDQFGVPVYYEKLISQGYDFKLQQNGNLSYYVNDWPNARHIEIDSSYQFVKVHITGNGYSGTDFHELLLLENGHSIVQTYDPQLVDMSQVVPGGDPNAIVSGWIIQEKDNEDNVIFQWRSWDHFEITDADENTNLLDPVIDYVHGNSIELTDDNAMLLSPRNFNEITKIDRNTGEIIWRLGGENNMFTFTNDTLRFSRAHDVRVMENGNISLFDNGTYHPEPQYSSIIEYNVDEVNMEVTLIRRLRSDPDIFGIIMGDAQERPDGSFITGWGSGVPGVTEFNPDNEAELEVYFAGINYRAFRFPWHTNLFSCNTDSLKFGYIWYQNELIKSLEVINPADESLELTSYHLNGTTYTVETEFPITIPAQGSEVINIKFSPEEAGSWEDVLTLNSDINSTDLTRRVARQVKLTGYATQGQSVSDVEETHFHLYPNPTNTNLTILLDEPENVDELSIVNLFGSVVKRVKIDRNSIIKIPVDDLPAGVYSMQVKSREGLLKQSLFIKN
ncbi:MAG TPA: arylsulfotransferase family protein [Bacteroidales bacterium]|nr:arylsulfotransferase family protein [Bacteroidales bacterium]HRX98400.1 arylsulfotransferase family protein [Bacteroidales bacterium]